MNILSAIKQSKGTMKRKLFAYMMVLVLVILLACIMGLSLIGRFNSEEKAYYEMLDIQMRVFEEDMSISFENLAVMGICLSEDVSKLLDEYSGSHEVSFYGNANSNKTIKDMQEIIMEPLQNLLLQADCSGAFVILNTTVGTDKENTKTRSGIYLQKRNVTAASPEELLLYRGNVQVGKKYGIMPHRKWRMEFQEEWFVNDIIDELSIENSRHSTYDVSEAVLLPGTSEKAMLLTVPLVSGEGGVYGVCGFEINESYFKSEHAQTSKLPHLTCILTKEQGNLLDTTAGLTSGVRNGYYLEPEARLSYNGTKDQLVTFAGENSRTIGMVKGISLSPDNTKHLIAVMIPKKDYENAVRDSIRKTAGFIVLLILITVLCCLYLSRKFIYPVEREREKAYLAYIKAQEEISKLAYSRKKEVDPDEYQYFIKGIESLTPTEKCIFEHYLSGRTVKEIMELCKIKESTLRYHNQNIYRKLGVNSLKQMLRYAAIWKQEEDTVRP